MDGTYLNTQQFPTTQTPVKLHALPMLTTGAQQIPAILEAAAALSPNVQTIFKGWLAGSAPHSSETRVSLTTCVNRCAPTTWSATLATTILGRLIWHKMELSKKLKIYILFQISTMRAAIISKVRLVCKAQFTSSLKNPTRIVIFHSGTETSQSKMMVLVDSHWILHLLKRRTLNHSLHTMWQTHEMFKSELW